MTGAQLREALKLLGYTQAEFAEKVGKTQKAVSLWVTGASHVPKAVSDQVTQLLVASGDDVLERIAHPPLDSADHSWPQEVFDLLWRDAEKRKRVKQIVLE